MELERLRMSQLFQSAQWTECQKYISVMRNEFWWWEGGRVGLTHMKFSVHLTKLSGHVGFKIGADSPVLEYIVSSRLSMSRIRPTR